MVSEHMINIYVRACIHIGDVVDVMISLSEMKSLSEIACVDSSGDEDNTSGSAGAPPRGLWH